MCGIVGYTGPREAGPILMEGLKRLEYRGYDSAGIALVDDEGDLFVEKRAGKLANLQTAIADRTPHAAIGIAHTIQAEDRGTAGRRREKGNQCAQRGAFTGAVRPQETENFAGIDLE